MAENLGAIRYEVEVDTANMLKAESAIDKSITGIAQDFDRADKAVREFADSQKAMGRTINSMGQIINKNGKIVSSATIEYRKLAATAQDGFTNLNTRVNGATSSMRNLGGAMGNVGYQIQDIAVQAQMGVNPLIIFTQQVPQLLMGFGTMLPVIGSVVAILGVLATTMIDTTSSMEKMEKSIEQVKSVMTLGAGGVAQYTEEMDRLSEISDRLTKLKLAVALADQQEAIKTGVESIRDALDDTRGSFDSYQDQIENITGSQVGTDAFAQSERAVRSFSTAVRTLTSTGGIGDVEDALDGLVDAGAASTKSGRELLRVTTDLVVKYKEGEITLKALKDALNGNKDAFDGVSESAEQSFNSIIQGLVTQNTKLREGERAAFAMSLALKGFTQDQVNAALSIYDNNKALDQQKEKAEADAQAMRQLNDELDAFFESEAKQDEQRDAQQTATLTRQVQSVGLTPEEEIMMQYERELAILEQAKEKEIEIRGTYAQRAEQIEAEKNASLKRLREQEAEGSKTFLSQYGGALGAINDLFGSYVNSMDKDTKASFDKWKKFATAQALVSTFLAVGNALATPAPWPVPLVMAGVAGAAGAMNVAQIQSQQFSGGRQYGGPVSSGNMYRVNETGVPEIYSSGGKDYLMGTQNAQITPLDKMGGGNEMKVEVNNYTPYQVYVTKDQAAGIARVEIGNEASKLKKGQGQMAKAMKSSSNYRTNATR